MFTPKNSSTLKDGPLLVFDTHPIQYRTPVFKHLSQLDTSLKVYFFNSGFDSQKPWFHEVGKSSKENFGLNLVSGFTNETLSLSQIKLTKRYGLLKQILKKERPRAILIFGYYLPEHWMLRALTAQLKIPLLFIGETFSRGDFTSWRRYAKEGLTRFFFSGVTKFISIGKKNKKFYRDWDVPAQQIADAHYCVDNEFFRLPESDSKHRRNTIREQLGIPQDAFVILYVGRLFSRKRPLDVVDLHKRFFNFGCVHTVMVGRGEMEKEIKKVAESIPNFHAVGFKTQDETKSFYHASDVLFVPSTFETWGLVVNEAMASGIPAIVTENCGVANDLVIPNETGFVFKEGDLAAAESMVRILITNSDRRMRLCENAKRHVNGEYTPEVFAKTIYRSSR